MKKLATFLFAMCIMSSMLFAQDISEVKAKIKGMNDSFSEMMINNDHQGMIMYYTEDCISLPSYQPMLRGIDAIKKSSEMQEQSGMKTTAFSLTTTDLWETGDYYIEIGTYNITMELPQMKMPYTDNGKYINVWQKFDDGSLKLKADIWNSDLNPWMEMQKFQEGEHEHQGEMEKGEG